MEARDAVYAAVRVMLSMLCMRCDVRSMVIAWLTQDVDEALLLGKA